MNTDTIAQCMTLSFSNTPFPEVVKRLAGAGVRAYDADLIRLRNTYYGAARQAQDEALPLSGGASVAGTFDKSAVAATVHAIQNGEIGYADFLRRIMAAGCASYRVFIDGRKVIYFGRDGDFHIEEFPRRDA
jgi:uncharacterized protein YbcV (DUF1398 family)